MSKQRLEAFSDGVIAILITIMVLELKVPHGAEWRNVVPLLPVLLSYALSFINVGIYWNNHHHMLHLTERINGRILWANLHFLFWLSLIPFVTNWLGENHEAPLPAAMMGVVLVFCALAWMLLLNAIVRDQGPHSRLRAAVGHDRKSKISGAMYASAIPLAFVHPWISDALYVTVALMWFVPDTRIERALASEGGHAQLDLPHHPEHAHQPQHAREQEVSGTSAGASRRKP